MTATTDHIEEDATNDVGPVDIDLAGHTTSCNRVLADQARRRSRIIIEW